MKLKKTKSRTYKGKDYFRWTIQIPPDEISRLGWSQGEELMIDTRTGELRVRRRQLPRGPSPSPNGRV
jgi:hypothetical protein